MAVLRTFLAVPIPATPALVELVQRVRQAGGDRRSTAGEEQFHVTLKFLGETRTQQLPEIQRAVAGVLTDARRLSPRLCRLGAFPHVSRPRVVWLGLDDAGVLADWAGRLDRALEPLGFAAEVRPFTAHLTLLRLKDRVPPAILGLLEEFAEVDCGTVNVTAVQFLQSELTPRGARYTPLAEWPLA